MTDQLWLIALICLAAAILLTGLCLAASVVASGLTLRGVLKWVLLLWAAGEDVNRRKLSHV